MIELQILNKILSTKDFSMVYINNISDEFFSDYKKEYLWIKDHVNKYDRVPDKESFISNFPSFDIVDVKEDDKYLINELYKDRNTRIIAQNFNKIRDLLNADKIDEAVNLYTNASQTLSEAKQLIATNVLEDKSRYDAYVERSNDFTKFYVKTGFREIDDALNGWDRLEELATIVARPGCSKTWILLKSATSAAAQGLKVGIYSGEMTENKVSYRIDTLLSNISNRKLLQGNIEIQNDYKRYLDTIADKVSGSIELITTASLGKAAGVTDLRAFIEKYKLDILFIDQHSLLSDDRKGRSTVERAYNISTDLKILQSLKKIPIIAVSQQNREKVETDATVANIAQNDKIGQDSTTVLFLDLKDNILTIYISKSRDAISGSKLQYAVDLDKGIFTYIPTESDALKGKASQDLRAKYDSETPDGGNEFDD